VRDDRGAGYRADDARLLSLVRAGDTAAYEVLCRRHEQAADLLAGLLAPQDEAGHAVAEAFAEVRDEILRGGGPADAFRPYLLAALAQAAGRGPRPGGAVGGAGDSVLARAFASLPGRWIAVLWHADIEETSPADTARILGLGSGRVAALRRRARNGLRKAYLQQHFSGIAAAGCQPLAKPLAALVRDSASRRDTATATEHLSHCPDCRAVYAQLTDINIALRTQVAPVYLGTAAAAYLSATHRAAAAAVQGRTARAGMAVQTPALEAESSAAAGAASVQTGPGHRARRWRRPSRPLRWIAAGTAGVAVIGTALALALAGQGTSQTLGRNQQVQAVGVPTSEATTASPVDSPPAATRQPASAGTPTQTPSPAAAANGGMASSQTPLSAVQAAAAELSATVAVSWHRQEGTVTFAVKDTGSAATGEVTVSLVLPPDSYQGQVQGETGGWTCQPSTAGATCQHSAIAAGSQTPQSVIAISTENQGCHQVVEMTAVSGNASASAKSGQIPC
jgi:hypothetical protein